MPSIQFNLKRDDESVCLATTKETEWLDHMREHVEEQTERNKEDIQKPTTQDVKEGAEYAHCLAMIKQARTVVMKAVQHLNPGQTAVVAFDQPLYALAKEIQMDESRHDGRREAGGYAWGTPHRVSSSQGNRIFALRKRVDRHCCASQDHNNCKGGVISDFSAHHAQKIRTSSHCILITYTPTQGLQEVFKSC